ncbi:anaerobic dehydrogenases [Candidatus Scalindua japonica]|uniref:Anaerobic dehydrogenases n=1 Tax=Candidatus Scalindua japonica TaxID=1284222 RepID=A0A286TX86_9BACT|nr:hypothetical protein [Candidatus Scalindua japonica]GAX60508.1 anaerobic dehydrogenases [Candidatus Scalindua japonica]
MLENLYYSLSDDTDDARMTNTIRTNRLNTNIVNIHDGTHFTIMDLVTIFTDEADKVCANKRIANLIAMEALNDYVQDHVNNVKIST